MMPRTIFAALAALALACTLVACAKQETPPEPVRPVKLARVSVGETRAMAVFAGEVKPRHESELGFRIAGKLVARYQPRGAARSRSCASSRLPPAEPPRV